MRTKSLLVWGLGLSALACQFATIMSLRIYAAFYAWPHLLAAALAVVLIYLSVMVLLWAERWPHRWNRYAPLYLINAAIGLFVPGITEESQFSFAVVGMLPMLLISGMWLVKRYWTVRV